MNHESFLLKAFVYRRGRERRSLQRSQRKANFRVDEALPTKNLSEPQTRLNSAKEALSTFARTESSKEMDNLKTSAADEMVLLSDCKRKIQELDAELDRKKESEANLFDSLVMQTKQLEQSKILLEESKLEIASLREKVEAFQGFAAHMKTPDESQQNEKLAAVKVKTLLQEMALLKYELEFATEAEEKSKKAMDDLALVLKEVTTEANQMKEKLCLSQVELENTKGKAERLRLMLKVTENKYKELLDETKKEADQYNKIAERLRIEAEESLLAWNGKETEFVNCIRRVDVERSAAQKETTTLLESLRVEENKTKVSKEDNQKLRDILKHALNEANAAKETAGIARAENSQLHDTLAEMAEYLNFLYEENEMLKHLLSETSAMEESLNLLSQENEMLKIHHSASFENITKLKRLLSETSLKELENKNNKEISSAKEPGEEDEEVERKVKADKEHEDGNNILSKASSFNLKKKRIPHEQHKEENEEGNYKDTNNKVVGSRFYEVGRPDSASHHGGETANSVEYDDMENERNSRKRRALLQIFGDLIVRRKGNDTREPSNKEFLPG